MIFSMKSIKNDDFSVPLKAEILSPTWLFRKFAESFF